MRAVYYDEFQTLPVVATLPDPAPAPGGVVVKVEATGLCRSDWHGWMGHDPDIRLPHVPGHELAGVVVAVGPHVARWVVGDRVTVPFVAGCGRCAQCASGNQQVCVDQFQPGFTAWGSFAQYVALDFADGNLVRVPDTMDYATAAGLGCRFATAFRAVVDQGRTRPGEWVAVHGCGGVGLSAIMIAAALGAQVVAVDLTDAKLALAREMGATAVVKAGPHSDVAVAIADVTGGGAHVSIDALGHPATCFNSISCLRRQGRHVQVGLMLDDHATPPVPMARIIAWELEVRGSHGMQAHRYADMMAMIAQGALQPQKLLGQRIALDAAPAALAAMNRFDGAGITIITP